MSRRAFVQCFSGVSGDMLLGALVDLGVDPRELERELQKLHLPSFGLQVSEVDKGGLRAVKVTPRFGKKERTFKSLSKVNEALRASDLDRGIVNEAGKLFRRLAEAEASVHGGDAGSVHFHELGSADTLVDVVGVLWGWKRLGITEGYASAPNLGSGEVATAHGVFSVPAPATARLLEGWPVYADGEEGEKTTPTGALLLTHLCRPADGLPGLTLEKTGFGAGERDFPSRSNVLQVLLGSKAEEVKKEDLLLLETNIDDLNPQVLGSLIGLLLEHGALEAFITPVVMKKGRPGHLLTALVPPSREAGVGALIFRETGSLGYRTLRVDRTRLERQVKEVRTPYGTVRVKTASFGGETVRFAPEYEDCRRLAKASGRPVREIIELVSGLRAEEQG